MAKEKQMKKKKLTDKEIHDCCHRIAEPCFKFIKKKMKSEMEYLNQNISDIDMSDIVNITINVLASIDANIFMMTKNVFMEFTGHDMDLALAIKIHIDQVTSILDKDELSRLKEKMN